MYTPLGHSHRSFMDCDDPFLLVKGLGQLGTGEDELNYEYVD